jgi:hypothetical protein
MKDGFIPDTTVNYSSNVCKNMKWIYKRKAGRITEYENERSMPERKGDERDRENV